MTLGLTGGMGCGKSTALRFFATEGFQVLDSDQVVREEVLREPEVVSALRSRWPDTVDPDGVVSRAAIAARVFDPQAPADNLAWLEDLIHPRVFARWQRTFGASPDARWVVEVPLLFEKKLEKWFDFTVCVAASSPNQFSRLATRGLTRALVNPRISRQLPLAQKSNLLTFVLTNDAAPEALHLQVARLSSRLGGRQPVAGGDFAQANLRFNKHLHS